MADCGEDLSFVPKMSLASDYHQQSRLHQSEYSSHRSICYGIEFDLDNVACVIAHQCPLS
jgi:hypothetical protein